jgi:hypothetical protein
MEFNCPLRGPELRRHSLFILACDGSGRILRQPPIASRSLTSPLESTRTSNLTIQKEADNVSKFGILLSHDLLLSQSNSSGQLIATASSIIKIGSSQEILK